MFVILMEWVLKFIRMLVYFLSPHWLVRATENPPFYIFRFNHKYAIYGNNDMINLSGSVLYW